MIVWSTSFSFIALFSPKIFTLFKISRDNRSTKNKVSDISSGRKDNYSSYNNKSYSSQHHYHSRSTGESSNSRMQQQSFGELLSLNGVLNGGDLQLDRKPNEPLRRSHQQSSDSQYQLHHRQLYHRIQTTKPDSLQPILQDGGIIDGYEGHMPLQRVFRYFPFLSTWNMQQIVLLPAASYFSYFSVSLYKINKRTKRTTNKCNLFTIIYVFIYFFLYILTNRNTRFLEVYLDILMHLLFLLKKNLIYLKFMAIDSRIY